jgi:gliding motility-associated-like protein
MPHINTMQPPVTFGPDTLCVQSVIDIPFLSYGVYQPNNNYIALLSDSSGSFLNPDTIGISPDFTTYDPTINPAVPGFVGGLVPVVPDGCNYYIQIVATNPVTYGTLFGPFCIHHCDIETNNTLDVHICVLDTVAVCDTIAVDLDVYGQDVQYLLGNQFLLQLLDPQFYVVINTGGLGAVYDTAINSMIICAPPLVDLLAMGIAPGSYYARVVADSTNSTWNFLGTLIHLTIGAPVPTGPTIIPSDTAVCQNDVVYLYIAPYNPDSDYQWVSDCLAGDDGLVGSPLSWPYNPLAILFTPGANSYDCTFQVRETNFGCTGPWSNPVTIYALGPPDIDIAGPNPICIGDTSHYTVPFFPETYFQWTVDTNVAEITNLANDEVYLIWKTPGVHYLVCYANNVCGFESIDSVAITVVEPVEVDAGEDTTICGSDLVELEALIWGSATEHSVTTLLTGTSGSNGAMFDVNALNEITITSFESKFTSTNVDVEIYYRAGAYSGFENTPSAWTLVGSTTGLVTNSGNQVTPIPIPVNVTIPAGQTYSFYITCTDQAEFIGFTNSGPLGNVYAFDNNLQIEIGIGMTYPFLNIFQPRRWNGRINYSSTSDFTFTWSDGHVGQVDPVTPDVTTTYVVTVSDTVGCQSRDTVTVFIKPTPVADAGPDVILCKGQTLQLQANGGDAYQWEYHPTLSAFFISNPTASPQSDITYVVEVMDTSSGCSDVDSVFILVMQNEVLYDSAGLCQGQPLELITSSTGSFYNWSTGESTSAVVVTAPGVYTVQISDDPSDCGIVEQFLVDFRECFLLLDPPNAFTPNGDGINDFFTIYGKDIAEWELWIFNRWGEVVYYTNDVSELNDQTRGWDGTHNGKPQDLGVYVYVVKAVGFEGTPIGYKGNLTLLR